MYGTKTDTEENKAQTFHGTYQEIYSSDGGQEVETKSGKKATIPDHEAVTGVAGLLIEEGPRSEGEASKKKRRRSEDSDDEVFKRKRKPD